MKKEKNTRGITLIALVVTIIVLIILAVVSINLIFSDNGLIKQAEKSKEYQANGIAGDEESLEGYANEIVEQTKEKESAGDGATKVAEDPETYYGKTVNYSANGINDWKIFYSNGTNIFLITSEYLQKGKIPTGAEMTTTETYQAYWKVPSTLDTANRQDELFMATGYTLNGDNFGSRCVDKLLNTGIWKSFAEGTKAQYAIGSPTIEMWIASWNERYPSDKIKCQPSASEKSADGYGYKVDWDSGDYSDNTIDSSEMSSKAGYSDTLYFPHKNRVGLCFNYWLASPAATNGVKLIGVNCEGYVSDYDYDNTSCALRPVVCLNYTVHLTTGSSDYDFDIN